MVKCCNRGKYLRCAFCTTNEHKVCPTYKPPIQTNADRIRAMTDEELAEFFSKLIKDTQEHGYCHNVEEWSKWLKSELKE